jgi:predicted DsbA family dithiol-disulfide isomerase
VRVDVWSDLVCPWCAIGKAHVGAALQRFEHADQVEVVWRSFELDPGAPVSRDGAYDALLAAKYGTSPAGGKAMVGRLSAAAELAGIARASTSSGRPTRSTRTASCTWPHTTDARRRSPAG